MAENGGPSEKEALRKLFVGGLDRNTTDETFRQHFEVYGNIVDLVIIRDKQTQASKGFGFVTYDNSAAVEEALVARPHELDSRTVEIKRAIPREENTETAHQRTKKLFIGGLPSNVVEDDITTYLNDTYRGKGEVVKCELIRNKETNEVRGFGFLEVSTEDMADLIIIKDPKPVIAGKKVEIKKCEDRSQGGGGRGGSRGGRGGGGRGRGGGSYGGGDRSQGGDSGGYWSGAGNAGAPAYNNAAYQGGMYGGGYDAYSAGFQNTGYGGYGAYNAGGYDQGGYGSPAAGGYGASPARGGRGAGGARYRPY